MPKQVVWKGFFEGDSGYIRATQRYPLATEFAGLPVSIMPFNKLQPTNPLNKYLYKGGPCLQILHQIPTVSPNEEAYFTVTEFDVAPHEWWNSLRKAKVILTQSKFCRDIFAKIDGVDKQKIKVVYYPQPENCVPNGPKLNFGQYDFVFGSVFEWVARKKPELAWEAFIQEFDKNENVVYVNKLSIPNGFRDWKRIAKSFVERDDRIKFTLQHYPDITQFYRGLDAFVSSSAGEGWGAGLSESMGCGIPTIAARHSGNLEFMNDKNSWLVDCDPWTPIGNDKTNHLWMVHDYQQWRLPKVESLRKAMREVYELRGKPNPRAIEGTKVTDMCSIKNIAGQINKALVDYL
jgi:glycosyltransferase involved in cell wall biosynthesis